MSAYEAEEEHRARSFPVRVAKYAIITAGDWKRVTSDGAFWHMDFCLESSRKLNCHIGRTCSQTAEYLLNSETDY